MKIKRISFIEAKSPGAHIFSQFLIPRIGAVLLSTILKERGYEIKVFVEDISEPDWSFVENSDLVCISTITSTAPRAYKIGDGLRAKGIPIIMGGVHPSFMPEEALEHADYVVRGEGDLTLPELVDDLKKENSISSINGISYWDKNGKVVHHPSSSLIEDLDSLPEPDFSLVKGWSSSTIYPISTSRGCPFNCKFCSVIQMFGRKYRSQSVEKTLKELKYVTSVSKSSLFFVDDNFAANKKRVKEILRNMMAEGIKKKWSAQVRTDIAKDPELLCLMADSQCDTLHIGFESINPKTLEAYNKKQDIGEMVECIKSLKDHGIRIHGMFVIGADTDSLDTIKQTADFTIKNGIDTVQFMMLTPLPGTPLFSEMQKSNRLLHSDWSKFDGLHLVFRPSQMNPQTLQTETLKAMAKFYSWKYIFKHLSKLEFYYAAVGFYGKKAVKRALAEAEAYFKAIGISNLDWKLSKY